MIMKLLPIVRKVSGSNAQPQTLVTEVVAHAKVDDDFFVYLNQFRWTRVNDLAGFGYPVRTRGKGERGTIYLHKEVAELAGMPKTRFVDHEDHDVMNAQKYNLRPTDQSGNSANSRLRKDSASGFKGVSWSKFHQRFFAYIDADKVRVNIGYFDDPIEAAKAYDEKAISLLGEFAKTNKMLGLL